MGSVLMAVSTCLQEKKIELSRLALWLESTIKLERAGQPCATKVGDKENSAEGSG